MAYSNDAAVMQRQIQLQLLFSLAFGFWILMTSANILNLVNREFDDIYH
jgi:hypothetical protein